MGRIAKKNEGRVCVKVQEFEKECPAILWPKIGKSKMKLLRYCKNSHWERGRISDEQNLRCHLILRICK